MFSILIRTSNRPRFFARCLQSVQEQTRAAYVITSTDNDADTYPVGDTVVKIESAPGRGHNLYFNTMRLYVPNTHPWVIHLDDDDKFSTFDALKIIQQHITDENALILWKVNAQDRTIPDTIGNPPEFGQITGIGFAVHIKHWRNWQAVAGGDFLVIDHYYRTLKPVWIDAVLTEFQSGAGGGRREDLN